MAGSSKQNYLRGAVILAAATLIVKLIGALFKIPLFDLLGGVGMGDFMSAYTIFNPIYSLAIAGLPVAVSKMVSENVALGRYRDARRIMHVSTVLFVCTGLVGTALMFFGARFFSEMIENPTGYMAIAAMAPAVMFCCLMSAVRGYYQGLKNMTPTAVSQVLEAMAKLLCGMAFASYAISVTTEQYEAQGAIFGKVIENATQAEIAIAQYAAVGAVLGVVASTVCSTLFLWVYYLLRGDRITREQLAAAPQPQARGFILRRMVSLAVPVCLAAVVTHLTSFIDLVSVMDRMIHCLETDAQAMLSMYTGLIPEGYDNNAVAKYLFGSYNGIAVTLFNLVPALTVTLGISVLPAISAANAVGDRAEVQRNVESALRVTSLVAMPAGLGFVALAEPICTLLYSSRMEEALIAAPLLRSLGIAVIFVALTSPVNSMLQAVGKVSVPVKLLFLGGLIKLAINYTLVGIPGVNIQGAPVGTIACYLFILAASLYVLERATGIRVNYLRVFGKTFLAAVLCGAAAWAAHGLLLQLSTSRIITLVSIGAAGVVYLVALLLLKALDRGDIIMLPMGEKIAKTLEKCGFIM